MNDARLDEVQSMLSPDAWEARVRDAENEAEALPEAVESVRMGVESRPDHGAPANEGCSVGAAVIGQGSWTPSGVHVQA